MKRVIIHLIVIMGVLAGESVAQSSSTLLRDANRGDVAAMRTLGRRLVQGKEGKKNIRHGVTWLQKAAEKGDTSSMLMLGDLHRNGDCVAKNMNKAIEYYEKAARAGNETAVKRLNKYKPTDNKPEPKIAKSPSKSNSADLKAVTEKQTKVETEEEKDEEVDERQELVEEESHDDTAAGKQESGASLASIEKTQHVSNEPSKDAALKEQKLREEAAREVLEDEFREAVECGDVEQTRQLIAKGVDVNAVAGGYLLRSAALRSRKEMVKLLLASGAKVDEDYDLARVLSDCKESKQGKRDTDFVDCVRLLLEAGASPDSRIETKTALHYAAEMGATDIVKLLIQAGANIMARNKYGISGIRGDYGYTPLIYAALRGHGETAKVLQEAQKAKK